MDRPGPLPILDHVPGVLPEVAPEERLHEIGRDRPPEPAVVAPFQVRGHPLGHHPGHPVPLQGRDGLGPVVEGAAVRPEVPEHLPGQPAGLPLRRRRVDDPYLVRLESRVEGEEGDLPPVGVPQEHVRRRAQPDHVLGGGLHRVGRFELRRLAVAPEIHQLGGPLRIRLHQHGREASEVAAPSVDPVQHPDRPVGRGVGGPDRLGVEGWRHGRGGSAVGAGPTPRPAPPGPSGRAPRGRRASR